MLEHVRDALRILTDHSSQAGGASGRILPAAYQHLLAKPLTAIVASVLIGDQEQTAEARAAFDDLGSTVKLDRAAWLLLANTPGVGKWPLVNVPPELAHDAALFDRLRGALECLARTLQYSLGDLLQDFRNCEGAELQWKQASDRCNDPVPAHLKGRPSHEIDVDSFRNYAAMVAHDFYCSANRIWADIEIKATKPILDQLKTICRAREKPFDANSLETLCAQAAERDGKTLGEFLQVDIVAGVELLARKTDNGGDFIGRLLAGPEDAELTHKELALLAAHLHNNRPRASWWQRQNRGERCPDLERYQKLKTICDFNRNLQAATSPTAPPPALDKATDNNVWTLTERHERLASPRYYSWVLACDLIEWLDLQLKLVVKGHVVCGPENKDNYVGHNSKDDLDLETAVCKLSAVAESVGLDPTPILLLVSKTSVTDVDLQSALAFVHRIRAKIDPLNEANNTPDQATDNADPTPPATKPNKSEGTGKIWFNRWRKYPYQDCPVDELSFQDTIAPTEAKFATIKAAFPTASPLNVPWPEIRARILAAGFNLDWPNLDAETIISLLAEITDKCVGSTPPTAKPEQSEGIGGAATPNPTGKRKRGRPTDTDPKEDKRIYEAWKTGLHRTQSDCDRELSLPAGGTYAACERHRKRLERRNKHRRTK